MFESYRAHHRINNLRLGFPLRRGRKWVGERVRALLLMRLQPIDFLVKTTKDGVA
jgi:hypothetical protein